MKRFVELGFNVVVNSRRCLSASRSLLAIALVDSDTSEPRLPPDARDRVGSPSEGGSLINNAGIFISKPCTDYKTEDFTSLSQAAHLSIDGFIRAVLGFDFDYGAGNAAETSSAKSPLSWSNVRRDGTRVTIIERGEQLLRREDSDVAEEVYKILREDGIDMGL